MEKQPSLTPNRLIVQTGHEQAGHMIRAAHELGNISLKAIANEGENYTAVSGNEYTVQNNMIGLEVRTQGNMDQFNDRVDQLQAQYVAEQPQDKAA